MLHIFLIEFHKKTKSSNIQKILFANILLILRYFGYYGWTGTSTRVKEPTNMSPSTSIVPLQNANDSNNGVVSNASEVFENVSIELDSNSKETTAHISASGTCFFYSIQIPNLLLYLFFPNSVDLLISLVIEKSYELQIAR